MENFSPEDIEILFEDERFIVVNKPAHLVVHPYRGRGVPKTKQSLMALTRDKIDQLVYPIHRLDGPVSGPVLFAKKGRYVKLAQDVWHAESTKKVYTALVKGILPVSGTYDFALKEKGGFFKKAITNFEPIRPYGETTLVEVEILTGRKHQIRRHFARRNHNLLGDVKHGRGNLNTFFKEHYGLDRIFLHCHQLSLEIDEQTSINISCPMPCELLEVLEKLEKNPFSLCQLPQSFN
ncbi:pseudouridine synthase [Halobacteriovorax sp. GB3]|uniref:pseudouridine synthase n=1 Tax=Halobacteriovorax sp. GB3 TaxID=2719615 RepID=UPI002360506D|nr:pseudouridine synthase [Halobacteriovorax sp. GB3]MDD0853035.1 pseudouridine synthase [Halobacteriovorax sp. GB3]